MTQKVLNEVQLREYIEGEVRKTLVNEIRKAGKKGDLNESLFSWESLIGSGLGRIILGPIIKSILQNLGVDPDGQLGKLIINAASTGAGAALGSWVDNKHNLIGK